MRDAHAQLRRSLEGERTQQEFNEVNPASTWRSTSGPTALSCSVRSRPWPARPNASACTSTSGTARPASITRRSSRACEDGDVVSAVAATRDHILAAHLLMMPEGHQIEPDYMLAAVLATT